MINPISKTKDSYEPDAWGVQRWRGRQPWGRHHRQSRPCTCRSHCRQPERQRPRHTSWQEFKLGVRRSEDMSKERSEVMGSGDTFPLLCARSSWANTLAAARAVRPRVMTRESVISLSLSLSLSLAVCLPRRLSRRCALPFEGMDRSRDSPT